jgi:YHS domain-containing protein
MWIRLTAASDRPRQRRQCAEARGSAGRDRDAARPESGGGTLQGRSMTVEKDPVCGMQVDPRTAAGKSEYQGKTYYFCAAGCKRKFDSNPQQYTHK